MSKLLAVSPPIDRGIALPNLICEGNLEVAASRREELIGDRVYDEAYIDKKNKVKIYTRKIQNSALTASFLAGVP